MRKDGRRKNNGDKSSRKTRVKETKQDGLLSEVDGDEGKLVDNVGDPLTNNLGSRSCRESGCR